MATIEEVLDNFGFSQVGEDLQNYWMEFRWGSVERTGTSKISLHAGVHGSASRSDGSIPGHLRLWVTVLVDEIDPDNDPDDYGEADTLANTIRESDNEEWTDIPTAIGMVDPGKIEILIKEWHDAKEFHVPVADILNTDSNEILNYVKNGAKAVSALKNIIIESEEKWLKSVQDYEQEPVVSQHPEPSEPSSPVVAPPMSLHEQGGCSDCGARGPMIIHAPTCPRMGEKGSERFRYAELDKESKLFDAPETLIKVLAQVCIEGVVRVIEGQGARGVGARIPLNPEVLKEDVRKIMPPEIASGLDDIPQQAFQLSFGITSEKWEFLPDGAIGFFSASTTDNLPTLFIMLHGLKEIVGGSWDRLNHEQILFQIIPSTLRHELRHYLQYVGSIVVRHKNGEELTPENISAKEWSAKLSYGTQKTVQGPQSDWEAGPGQKIKDKNDSLVSPMEYFPQTGTTADIMFEMVMNKLTTIPLSVLEDPKAYEEAFRIIFGAIIEGRNDRFLCALRILDTKRYFKALKNLYLEVKGLSDKAVASALHSYVIAPADRSSHD